MKKIFIYTTILLSLTFSLIGCTKNSNKKAIAVFVPGIIDDSPTYAKLTNGVKTAINEFNLNKSEDEKIELFIMEAGTNQAEWSAKITSLVAEQKYDLIISSNPSLPELVEPITKQFPNQKFILLDATKEGNQNIYTVCYNQAEQGYLAGYIAGLMTKSKKLALIAAQEYPVMNEIIFPSFVKGAQESCKDATVDFRIVGNWYDATKGAEIADAVIKNGVDVILPICGGASQGVIKACSDAHIYISWFDDSGFSRAPGTIIGSSTVDQEKMANIVTTNFLNGKIDWGKADMVGVKDGFVTFIQDDENYKNTVPKEFQNKMAELLKQIQNGELVIQ